MLQINVIKRKKGKKYRADQLYVSYSWVYSNYNLLHLREIL